MFRYLALQWDSKSESAARAADAITNRMQLTHQNWTTVQIHHGLRLLCSSAQSTDADVILLPNSTGALLGTIYRRCNPSVAESAIPSAPVDEPYIKRIVKSEGRSLISECWGSYVLFLSSSNHQLLVLRGPMSDLPCYYTEHQGVRVFFAHLEDCLDAGIRTFTPRMAYVRAVLAFGDPRSTETALNEVESLDVGECVTFSKVALSRQWYWHPKDFTCDRIYGLETAVHQLREATRTSVAAMAARHRCVTLLLSGGLDSSIVAACLRSASTGLRVECLNHRSPSLIGDERHWARDVANRCGFRLLEREESGIGSIEDMLASVRATPTPAIYAAGRDAHLACVEFSKQHQATAMFSGSMGDCVFGRGVSLMAAAEQLQTHGLTPDLFRVCYDVGLRQRLSIWRVLGFAFRLGWLHRPRGPWNHYAYHKQRHLFATSTSDGMLTHEALEQYEAESDRYIHPWLQSAEFLPIGKLIMISVLTMEMPYDNPYLMLDEPVTHRPLASQLVSECALRIATPLHVHRGWDRAVARRAFAPELPRDVLRRNSKGSPLHAIQNLVAQNAKFIREFLLDGLLVRENLLNRARLEAALPGKPTRMPTSVTQLISHVYTEAWLRRWRTH